MLAWSLDVQDDDSEDDFAPAKPQANDDSEDDFAPAKPKNGHDDDSEDDFKAAPAPAQPGVTWNGRLNQTWRINAKCPARQQVALAKATKVWPPLRWVQNQPLGHG